DAGLRARPVARCEAVEPRRVAAEVLRDHPDRVGRNGEAVALRVLQDEVVALGARDGAARDADVATDTVHLVDGVVAGRELQRERVPAPLRDPGSGTRMPPGAEEVVLGRERDAARVEDEALLDGSFLSVHGSGLRRR